MRNFEPHEFNCKGVECFDKMDETLLEKLDNARDIAGISFILTSTWRNYGSETSSHRPGLAVDISATDSRTKWIIVNSLIKAGFKRIGIGEDFVHGDVDESKPGNLIWTY